MNFDPNADRWGPTVSYKPETPKPKQQDVIIVSDGQSVFSTGAQLSAILAASNVGCSIQNVNDAFQALSNVFGESTSAVSKATLRLRYYTDELLDRYSFDNHDHGPDFDNRSWAFLKQQQIVFENQLRNKKYLFPKINNNKLKLFKLKSMNSRSGYRGIKTIKKGN